MHIVFAVIAAIALLLPMLTIGLRLLLVVVSYNVLLPFWSWKSDESKWFDIWQFVLPLSIFQVFPDWFLAAELNTIVFEQDPYIMIGGVPAYMAGLWAIPLFVIIYLGLRVEEKYGRKISLFLVASSSLIVFVMAEATLWMLPAWTAQNVFTIGHVAVYIILPEILLGISSFLGYQNTQRKWIVYKIGIAFVVMILYIGNASFFYFIIEGLILGG